MPLVDRWSAEDIIQGFNHSDVAMIVRNKVKDNVRKCICKEVNDYYFKVIDKKEFMLREAIRFEMNYSMNLYLEFYKIRDKVTADVLNGLKAS
jgi:hypothetical protein